MIDPFSLAIGGASLLLGSRGGKKYDPRAVIDKYRNERPVGYLTPEDEAQSERLRLRRAASAGKLASDAGAGIRRRAAVRGIAGSPSVERDLARVTQLQGAAGEEGARSAEDFLYRTRAGREAFEQEKLMAAFGAELGANERNFAQGQARQSSFWNSLNQYLPFLTDSFSSGVPTDALSEASSLNFNDYMPAYRDPYSIGPPTP